MNTLNHRPSSCRASLISTIRTVSIVVIVILLGACSKDNPTTPSESITYTPPRIGSSFHYSIYDTDTTTSLPITKSYDTTVHIFSNTEISYQGKNNVSKIYETSPFFTNVTYLNYESNGDVSVYVDRGNGEYIWLTLPMGSKTTKTLVFMDTTKIVSGVTTRSKYTSEASYVGTENLTIKGKSVSVLKMKLSNSFAETVNGVTTTKTMAVFFYFAPSLGYYVKTEQPVQVAPWSDVKQEGHEEILIYYIN